MAGEKTEKATPKRKSDERKKGNIFQSKEITTIASLVVMFYSLKIIGPYTIRVLQKCFIDFISKIGTTEIITFKELRVYFIDCASILAVAVLPFLLISCLVAVVVTAAQTKMLFTTKSLAFKGNRINPLEGFKKMFSIRSIVELLKSLFKITILGSVIYTSLIKLFPIVPRMFDMDINSSINLLGDTIMSIVNSVAVIFIVLACSDYAYQWWERWEERLGGSGGR